MKLSEVKKEISETSSLLKSKKALMLKYEKARDEIVKKVNDLQKRLSHIDDVINGKAHSYYTEKSYETPYSSHRYRGVEQRRRHVTTVKYPGLYEEIKSLEEQLSVLRNIKKEDL